MDKFLKFLFALLFFAAFLYGVHYLKQHSPNANDAMLNELLLVPQQIPDHPRCVRTEEDTSSRYMDAGVYLKYKCSDIFPVLVDYYRSRFTRPGWTEGDSDSKHVVFTNGEFTIKLENASGSSDWNFAVSYAWHDQ